jgi:hypothetical protein
MNLNLLQFEIRKASIWKQWKDIIAVLVDIVLSSLSANIWKGETPKIVN